MKPTLLVFWNNSFMGLCLSRKVTYDDAILKVWGWVGGGEEGSRVGFTNIYIFTESV